MKQFYLLLLLLVCGHRLFAQLPTDSLKGHYTFAGTLFDVSGNGNHIAAGSGLYATDRFGNPGQAFRLNGTSDSLSLPIPEFAPIQADFTISLWYKTNSPNVMNLFSSKQFPTDTTNNLEVQLNSHSQQMLAANPGIWYQSYAYWNGTGVSGNAVGEGAPGAFTKGEWCHFVIEREADTLRIYRNHQLYIFSLSADYGGPLGDVVNLIFSASPHRFSGDIDDLRCYNRCLSQAEIDLLWFENRPFVFVQPLSTDAYVQGSNVLAYWEYDTTQVSDSILVEYRINAGSWTPAVHSNMAWEYFTYVNMNLPPGTTVEVRVSDFSNPAMTASTGTFIVSEYDWVEVSDSLPWNPKDGSGLLNFNGRMWALGGWDPPNHPPYNTHNEVWSSTDGANWTPHGNAPWPARHCSAWLVYDSAMWVIGGDPQSGCLRDVWKSTDGINWLQVEDTIPNYTPKHNANYAAFSNKMLLYGGSSCGVWPPITYNEVWESADGLTWNQLPAAPWTGRSMQINSCVDSAQQMWVLGGAGEHDRRSYNDIWKTTDGITWTLVNEAAPWRSRYWHTTAWYDNKMWIMAGMATAIEMNDVWYSPDGITWRELKSTTGNWPASTRHAQSTTVYDNALWYTCGINTNSAWKLVNTTNLSSVATLQAPQQLVVYPNPNNGQFTVRVPQVTIGATYTIVDLTGRCVQSGQLSATEQQIELQQADSGLYLLHIEGYPGLTVKLSKQ